MRWLVLPYIFTELIRLLVLVTCHIISMMLMKKKFDLGLLICVTVGGGFVLRMIFVKLKTIILA
jgi:hypothetical protein